MLATFRDREQNIGSLSLNIGLLWDAPYPVEPIVYPSKELERRRDLPFMRQVLMEGKVIHERRKAAE